MDESKEATCVGSMECLACIMNHEAVSALSDLYPAIKPSKCSIRSKPIWISEDIYGAELYLYMYVNVSV